VPDSMMGVDAKTCAFSQFESAKAQIAARSDTRYLQHEGRDPASVATGET
jgi:hypothetical protein